MSRSRAEALEGGLLGRPGDQIVIYIADEQGSQSLELLRKEMKAMKECLAELKEKIDGEIARPGLMTKKEVADYLRVSVRQVDRLRAGGRLPEGEVIGGRRRWRSDEIIGADEARGSDLGNKSTKGVA